jgi:hypothetical protein
MGLALDSFPSADVQAILERAFAPIPVGEHKPRKRRPVPAPRPVGDARLTSVPVTE